MSKEDFEFVHKTNMKTLQDTPDMIGNMMRLAIVLSALPSDMVTEILESARQCIRVTGLPDEFTSPTMAYLDELEVRTKMRG